mmetsp:Transcript_15472/g.31030  ORF Transcript_15472/g.31030 Transcript_15472/m.31030 type:complete len:242 (-) Transcript_15472:417-1142(-)
MRSWSWSLIAARPPTSSHCPNQVPAASRRFAAEGLQPSLELAAVRAKHRRLPLAVRVFVALFPQEVPHAPKQRGMAGVHLRGFQVVPRGEVDHVHELFRREKLVLADHREVLVIPVHPKANGLFRLLQVVLNFVQGLELRCGLGAPLLSLHKSDQLAPKPDHRRAVDRYKFGQELVQFAQRVDGVSDALGDLLPVEGPNDKEEHIRGRRVFLENVTTHPRSLKTPRHYSWQIYNSNAARHS